MGRYKAYSTNYKRHHPNKSESKTLRRLMSQNGMTEKEVRSIEKYRIILSEAQKSSSTSMRSDVERMTNRMLSECSRKLKLPKYHPEVRKAFEKKWKDYWRSNSNKICEHYNVTVGKERELLTERRSSKEKSELEKEANRFRLRRRYYY